MAPANNLPSTPLPPLAGSETQRLELLPGQGAQRAPATTPPEEPAAALPTLSETALYGLTGVAVRSLALHSEADPAAILLQFLAAFGNMAGPAPHSMDGLIRHGLNLFVVLVGESSKARKTTSWRQISSLFNEADPRWVACRVTAARPTAYRILYALRDQ
jgi:hypothetical protein